MRLSAIVIPVKSSDLLWCSLSSSLHQGISESGGQCSPASAHPLCSPLLQAAHKKPRTRCCGILFSLALPGVWVGDLLKSPSPPTFVMGAGFLHKACCPCTFSCTCAVQQISTSNWSACVPTSALVFGSATRPGLNEGQCSALQHAGGYRPAWPASRLKHSSLHKPEPGTHASKNRGASKTKHPSSRPAPRSPRPGALGPASTGGGQSHQGN